MNWSLLTALHALPTFFLCGLVWFVQVVHYPLYAAVGAAELPAYERRHCRRITPVVAPPMLAEAALAVWLCAQAPAEQQPWAVTGLALLAVVWGSTFLLQVPCHDRLSQAPDAAVLRRLVATNWLRTAAWTLRAAIAFHLLR